MKNYEVYLAGPITGLTFGDCTNWRDNFAKLLNCTNIHTLSPMRGKDHLAIDKQTDEEHKIQDSYDDNPMTSKNGINTRDYNDVKRSDVVVFNMLGAERVSIGTVMEMAWCRAFGKPVVLIMEDSGNIHEHCMFLHYVGFRVNNIVDAVSVVMSLCLTDQELK